MNITSLNLQLDTNDLYYILNLPQVTQDDKIEDLNIQILAGLIIIKGKYSVRFFNNLPFTTNWKVSADENGIYFTLEKLDPLNFIKHILLNSFKGDFIKVESDTIMFDIKGFLKSKGIPIQYGTMSIACLNDYISLMLYHQYD